MTRSPTVYYRRPMSQSERRHTADFKLSITKALADQLAERLEPLCPIPLTEGAVDDLDPRPGVYLLYHQGHRVYVGKAQNKLATRLGKHWRKVRGRENLRPHEVGFVGLYVDEDLDAVAPETLLIRRYKAEGGPDGVPWNLNGFGNNDPGKRRDLSAVPVNHFDARYPVDLGWELNLPTGRHPLGRVLTQAKHLLPYNLRFEATKDSHRARTAYQTEIDVSTQPITTSQLLKLAITALPLGWQATALPGYVILYGEQAEFLSARVWWRREGGSARATHRRMDLAPEREVAEETADSDEGESEEAHDTEDA